VNVVVEFEVFTTSAALVTEVDLDDRVAFIKVVVVTDNKIYTDSNLLIYNKKNYHLKPLVVNIS
jgi:hypothetical protein